ncbi:hypothetical protein CEXT_490521 [Caerostris extrusa]|uniref:Uncharacterized protein n=1 Tax=Caerostris extrusa TaxID=172846 RepID=A0AAV4XXW4_CAEEX|nr:hypothetical protein CEXT_490521 [Caerostris extrusa]
MFPCFLVPCLQVDNVKDRKHSVKTKRSPNRRRSVRERVGFYELCTGRVKGHRTGGVKFVIAFRTLYRFQQRASVIERAPSLKKLDIRKDTVFTDSVNNGSNLTFDRKDYKHPREA